MSGNEEEYSREERCVISEMQISTGKAAHNHNRKKHPSPHSVLVTERSADARHEETTADGYL